MTQEKDLFINQYLEDPEHFADIYNGTVFQGKQIINPDHLSSADGDLSILIPDKTGRKKAVRRYRDVVKKTHFGVQFAILACENQTDVNYAMVIRSMLYDALNYTRQVQDIKSAGDGRHYKNSGEFLSGMCKSDKLVPVVTLVVYFGKQPWDAGNCLHDLLSFAPEMNELKAMIPNYTINVLDARRIDQLDHYHTGLREIFGALKYAEDKLGITRHIIENQERFSQLDLQTFELIHLLLGESDRLDTLKNIAVTDKKGVFNMCKAFDDIRKEERSIGEKEGVMKGENRFAALSRYLLQENRIKDLMQATTDLAERNRLYQQYHLF